MKFLKNIFLALLLITSLDLTQTFAMEPDPNEEDLTQMGQIEQEKLSGSKREETDEPRTTKPRESQEDKTIVLKCSGGQVYFPMHLVGQSIFLSDLLNLGFKESHQDEDEIVVEVYAKRATVSKLIELMELAYQTAQSQNIVDLKIIKEKLALKIFDYFKKEKDSIKFENFLELADYLNIPLILRAFKNEKEDNILPCDLIADGFIPLLIINKALGLDPKSLDFYTIEKNIKTNKQLCEKISNLLLSNTDDKFYLSQFLNQIPSEFFKNYLCNKIKNILEHTKINENFNLTPDLKILLSPKIFLRFLLVLHEENLEPPFLGKLSLLVTNNQLEGYELALAQALLCINNHEKKDNILSQLGIIGGGALINNAKTTRSLNLPSNDLGNSDNLNKFLFYIAIAQILNVTELDLSFKNLTSLPAEIGNLTSLKFLYLDGNNLTSLPAEIGYLTSLKFLYLDGNNLTSLPAEIGYLTSLKFLYLHENKLTSLPAEIGNLTSLKYLYLDGNNLTSLPAEIGYLTSLKFLYLHENKLTSLPAEIGYLTSLKELNLCLNQLTSLPPEIRNLTNLTKLYLNENNLTSLPPEIGNLTNLKSLNLSDNNLTSLPAEIGYLTSLKFLYLRLNQLTSLPVQIGNLTNLINLYLDGNNLTSLPAGIHNLSNLNLSNLKLYGV